MPGMQPIKHDAGNSTTKKTMNFKKKIQKKKQYIYI